MNPEHLECNKTEEEVLFNKLEEILRIEQVILETGKRGGLRFGNLDKAKYNGLILSIPILSVTELIRYHSFLRYKHNMEIEGYKTKVEDLKDTIKLREEDLKENKQYKQYQKEEFRKEVTNKILLGLKEICSPILYSEIEQKIESIIK